MDELNYNGFSNEENEIKSFGELNNTTGENVDANINGDVVENAAQYAAENIIENVDADVGENAAEGFGENVIETPMPPTICDRSLTPTCHKRSLLLNCFWKFLTRSLKSTLPSATKYACNVWRSTVSSAAKMAMFKLLFPSCLKNSKLSLTSDSSAAKSTPSKEPP